MSTDRWKRSLFANVLRNKSPQIAGNVDELLQKIRFDQRKWNNVEKTSQQTSQLFVPVVLIGTIFNHNSSLLT